MSDEKELCIDCGHDIDMHTNLGFCFSENCGCRLSKSSALLLIKQREDILTADRKRAATKYGFLDEKEIEDILQAEIVWCLDHPDETLSNQMQLGFMNGLRQAQTLLRLAQVKKSEATREMRRGKVKRG